MDKKILTWVLKRFMCVERKNVFMFALPSEVETGPAVEQPAINKVVDAKYCFVVLLK